MPKYGRCKINTSDNGKVWKQHLRLRGTGVQLCTYSRFRVFSPECTLHSAVTHVIKVWERRRLTWIPIAQMCVGVRRSNTKITWVIAECNVQSGLKTLKRLYLSCGCKYSLGQWTDAILFLVYKYNYTTAESVYFLLNSELLIKKSC